MDRRAKVELFEQIRREYEHGGGTIRGIARKFGIHRRMVREPSSAPFPLSARYQCVTARSWNQRGLSSKRFWKQTGRLRGSSGIPLTASGAGSERSCRRCKSASAPFVATCARERWNYDSWARNCLFRSLIVGEMKPRWSATRNIQFRANFTQTAETPPEENDIYASTWLNPSTIQE